MTKSGRNLSQLCSKRNEHWEVKDPQKELTQ